MNDKSNKDSAIGGTDKAEQGCEDGSSQLYSP